MVKGFAIGNPNLFDSSPFIEGFLAELFAEILTMCTTSTSTSVVYYEVHSMNDVRMRLLDRMLHFVHKLLDTEQQFLRHLQHLLYRLSQ